MVNIGNMMKQAQQLQKKMAEAQEKLNSIEVEGVSGGGVVKVTATAKGEIKRINIDESLLYSVINMAFQDNKYLIISSPISLKKFKIKLKDLNSRFTSFIDIGIDLPTDDLLRVILTKSFSDKQIQVSNKNIEYILKNIDRSYEKVNSFANSIDNLSLVKAKPINLQLIKKVLQKINQ